MPDTLNDSSESCPHTALTQRWNDPNDMGRRELATYVCEACGAQFKYEQAQELMQHPNVAAVERADEPDEAQTPAEPLSGA